MGLEEIEMNNNYFELTEMASTEEEVKLPIRNSLLEIMERHGNVDIRDILDGVYQEVKELNEEERRLRANNTWTDETELSQRFRARDKFRNPYLRKNLLIESKRRYLQSSPKERGEIMAGLNIRLNNARQYCFSNPCGCLEYVFLDEEIRMLADLPT